MSEQVLLAVFDCDGTLVDSQYSIIRCMRAAFDGQGLPRPDDEKIRRIVGLDLLHAIAILHPGISDAAASKVKEGYSKAWKELRQFADLNEPLYPKTIETLDEVSTRGWQLGVATGKSHRGLVHTLSTHDILGRFDTLQTADRAHSKPHPEMLVKAMEDVRAVPANTVMIGDTTFDMEMAQNAGVTAIGVIWGYHPAEELVKSGAHSVIKAYTELPDVLDTLKKTQVKTTN